MESGFGMSKWRIPLLVLSSIMLILGNCLGSMFTRLYFLHGGKSRWLSSGIQTAGFPIILLPLVISYMNRLRNGGDSSTFFLIKSSLFKSSSVAGLIYGVIGFFFCYGSSALPVSTSTLIGSCQLAFTAVFAYFLVNQKFNMYSINTVVSLTLAAGILGFQSSSDTPEGESVKAYLVGFVCVLIAALLNAFVMPFIEFAYKKANQEISYTLVMEFNMMVCAFSTAFCALGWFISNDYKGIVEEAKAFDFGEDNYYFVLALSTILWQCYLLGIIGVIFCSSSLLSGILTACTVPLTGVLGELFFHERFTALKCISLLLSIWGFLSYFYGEWKYTNVGTKPSQLGSPLISEQLDDDVIDW